MLKDYILAKSIDNVLEFFKMYPDETRVIAGGTDLMIDMEAGRVKCSYLVDITQIEELKKIELIDDCIKIGAAVTHNEVNKSYLIKSKAAALSEACGTVGSLQIRNIATLVGNVVKAQPAADGAVALTALGAEVEVRDSNGIRWIPLEDMYTGIGKTKIDCTNQLVTSIKFPILQSNQGSAFVRFAQRDALALPMLNVAVVLSLKHDNHVEWLKIAMSPVGTKPTRALSAEKILEGKIINSELINKAAKVAIDDAKPRDSAIRGTAEYRKEVLEVLVRRAMEQAVASIK